MSSPAFYVDASGLDLTDNRKSFSMTWVTLDTKLNHSIVWELLTGDLEFHSTALKHASLLVLMDAD